MSDEKKESRINIEDLPAVENELTAEEAEQVRGGAESIHLFLKSTVSADGSVRPGSRTTSP
jgi:hypothetical protein